MEEHEGYPLGIFPNNEELHLSIDQLSKETKSLDRFKGHLHPSDVKNVVPRCEQFGQNSSILVLQIKTKITVRHQRLFRDISRYVAPEKFVNELIYSPHKGRARHVIFKNFS